MIVASHTTAKIFGAIFGLVLLGLVGVFAWRLYQVPTFQVDGNWPEPRVG